MGVVRPLVPTLTSTPHLIISQGYPEDLVVSVALGADMFDCVWPTRTAVRIPQLPKIHRRHTNSELTHHSASATASHPPVSSTSATPPSQMTSAPSTPPAPASSVAHRTSSTPPVRPDSASRAPTSTTSLQRRRRARICCPFTMCIISLRSWVGCARRLSRTASQLFYWRSSGSCMGRWTPCRIGWLVH